MGKRSRDSNEELPAKPVRVGIVGIWSQGEAKKSELVSVLKKKPARPWLNGIREKFLVRRLKDHDLIGPKTTGVATDVAVGAYIEWAYATKDVAVDWMAPSEVSPERLARNHLNFHILYDDLEGFHADRSKGKAVWKRITAALDGADNLFPPRYYQKLINSKINYYNYCQSHDIPIATTMTLTREQYQKALSTVTAKSDLTKAEQVADQYWAKFEKLNWFRCFCKPVYGIESRDAKMFTIVASDKPKFRKYFTYILTKYPGIIIQQYVIGFGANPDMPEGRCVFVGDKYQFCMIQTDQDIYHPASENYLQGKKHHDFPIEKIKRFAASVKDKLPKMTVRGIELPRLTTRLDVGTRLHPPGLPDLRVGSIVHINKDAEKVMALCKQKEIFDEKAPISDLVGAGARCEIRDIDGSDNTCHVRWLDSPLKAPGKAGRDWFPIPAIDGYDESEAIKPFINEIEYCPSLFVEEALVCPEQIVGDQMVKIARLFVEGLERKHKKRKTSSSPAKTAKTAKKQKTPAKKQKTPAKKQKTPAKEQK